MMGDARGRVGDPAGAPAQLAGHLASRWPASNSARRARSVH